METDNNTILKALAEIRRGLVLSTKANPQTETVYSDAYAYALLHSVCPIFHEDPGSAKTIDERRNLFPFHETYDVPHSTVEMVAELMDKRWLAHEKITFYDIEGPYKLGSQPWPGKEVRNDLINICRYLRLHNLFDQQFWKDFLSSAPVEAADIGKQWDRQEIVDWMK